MEHTSQSFDQMYPSTDITLNTYITKAMSYPCLTKDEEFDLGMRKLNGDIDAAYQLTLSHIKLVVSIAKRYSGYGLPEEDLIQEGTIGLMQAVDKFEPNQNTRLGSYAVAWIKSHILEYVIANWRLVRNVTTKGKRKLFFNLRSMQSERGKLTSEERARVIKELAVNDDDINEMLGAFHGDLSLDYTIYSDTDFTLQDTLGDPDADPAVILESLEHETLALKFEDAIAQLPERERIIIQSRFLTDSKVTLSELSKQLGLSIERVRQIETKALNTLKETLTQSTLSKRH